MHRHEFSQANSRTLSLLCKNYLIIAVLSSLIVACSSDSAVQTAKPENQATTKDKKMVDIVGTYKFDTDDGKFDDFLKEMGVGYLTRKFAATTSPVIEVKIKADGTYSLSTTSTFKSSVIEFKLGEEFEEKRMDGETVKTTVTRDGNKLIHKQKANPPVEITREFFEDKMVTTCKCNNVVNVRTYKRVK